MLARRIVSVFILTGLISCSDNNQINNSNTSDSIVHEVDQHSEETSDDELFIDTCKCSFAYIGEIKSSKNRLDLIISGKGWNPNYYSCSYTWGELVNNEFPPDSTIQDFRVHLMDLEKVENLDSSFFVSKAFNDNLIATYYKGICVFDPNKTGKYPKPKQWIE